MCSRPSPKKSATAAVRELRAAIRVKPDYTEAYYTLGTVLKQQGKLPEAADALREAIRLQPDYPAVHTTLAAVLRQLAVFLGFEIEDVQIAVAHESQALAVGTERGHLGTGQLGQAAAGAAVQFAKEVLAAALK